MIAVIPVPSRVFDAQFLANVIAEKRSPRREVLEGVRARIEQTWAGFPSSLAGLRPPTALHAWDPTERAALLHLYESRTAIADGELQTIHQHFDSATNGLCPYCGIDDPYTIDHFIPKDPFPEFSIHPNNCIPCCARCNGKKGDRILSSRGHFEFVYLYGSAFRPVPRGFVRATVTRSANDLIAAFAFNTSLLTTGIREVVENHIANLDLVSRYRRACRERLREDDGDIQRSVARCGVAIALSDYRESVVARANRNGYSSWLTAMSYGILNFYESANGLPVTPM